VHQNHNLNSQLNEEKIILKPFVCPYFKNKVPVAVIAVGVRAPLLVVVVVVVVVVVGVSVTSVKDDYSSSK